MNDFTCSQCSKSYLNFKTLRQHIKKNHSNDLEKLAPLPAKTFKCELCTKGYNTKRAFSKHERISHNIEYVRETNFYVCPLCQYRHFCKNKLLEHFGDHNIAIEEAEHMFNTFEEFTRWKNETERKTNSRFVRKGGCDTKRKTKFIYYNCHRSGYFIINNQDRKRHLKTQGSKKINGVCPASLSVNIKQNGVTSVRFIQTHVGHENDLGHLTLSEDEKLLIAKKIPAKLPFNTILDEVRDSAVSDGEIRRFHLLTNHDLWNIENSFKLNISVKKHDNDAVSVDTWVQELGDCILFYKPQEQYNENYPQLSKDNFILVIMNDAQAEMLKKYGSDVMCIDGTHGLNQYNFELITLLVLDDLRQGFPCAFLICNRCDQDVLKIFFNTIKEKCGIVKPNVFMSDMANCFLNAFISAMAVPAHRLFCTWHVDRAWRKNLTKVKNKGKQVDVYKLLRTMLEETDHLAFEHTLGTAVRQLIEDPDTQEFGTYFQNEYVNCASSWAYCFRLNCGINTNMHLETVHKTIKYIYFQGKNTKRLDKMLHVLMKFIRDRLFDRIITLHKGKITKKMADLRTRHKSSQSIKKVSILKDKDGWFIQSSNGIDTHFIQQITTQCNCRLRCHDCKTCLHIFSCTCIDYCIKWNMCKHIHAICMSQQNNPRKLSMIDEPLLLPTEEPEEKPNEEQILKNEILRNKPAATAQGLILMVNEINQLRSEFDNIARNIKTKEQLEHVNNHLKSMKASISALESFTNNSFASTANIEHIKVAHNKKIIQQRIFSTKKTSKKNPNLIVKPSSEEQRKILVALLNSE